jgi:nucleoside-diphosphate-sugar epimerase
MKIVVCGAGGYVGYNLINYLSGLGYNDIRAISSRPLDEWRFKPGNCERVQADLREADSCRAVVAGAGWVFNLASTVGGIGFIAGKKVECMLSSLINTNLLRAVSQDSENVMGYFYASSSCVYPLREMNPVFAESDAYPANPTDGYGWEKLFSERMCLAFAEERKVPVSIARYHTIYGPGDVRDAGRDHVTAALCRKVIQAKLSGVHEINIWGDGEQTRSFLYIDDCVEGTYRILKSGLTGPVNLANQELVSVNRIVNMLENIAGIQLRRFYELNAPRGLQDKRTDNTKLRLALSWEPSTPIEVGLKRMYNEFWARAIEAK